ncbi:hypothetical protein KC614_04420, partial [candidate division WWE3 bacterium]|nr:hypothetical protein [candidate division WWE3 bacterium]
MTWLVYTLISLITISLFYVFTKRILNDELNSPKTYAAFLQLTVGAIAFILLLLFGDFYFDFTLKTTLIYIASGFVYAIAAGTF